MDKGGHEFVPANDTSGIATVFWLLATKLNVDIDYARWLGWLFTPVMIVFLLPVVILVLLYMNAFWLFIYKYRRGLVDAYRHDFWDGALKTLAVIWETIAWLWHGHEIEGLENIPDSGSALIVYYHGAIPIDVYYLLTSVILRKGRLIHTVGDRFLFKIPGWSPMLEAFKVIPGTITTCSNLLKEGNMLAISPGGVYEAQFGTEHYEVLWKKRLGFAKVAIDAQTPILPMFTQNIREAFRTVQWGSRFWHWLYSQTKLPLIPIYGFFPVKMKTIIGKPIVYDPSMTPEVLAAKTSAAIQNLILEYQVLPGSIWRALLNRFQNTRPVKSV